MKWDHAHQRNTQICCARLQPHIREKDLDTFVKRPEVQLRNLPVTYSTILEDMDPYDIREMFHDSDIPFRFKGCVQHSMTCCCTCMRKCPGRCPQDVLYRAYLLCGYLLDAPPGTFDERWERSPMMARMLYLELTKEKPCYEVVLHTVESYLSIRTNKELREIMLSGETSENPNKLVYAPAFEYESRVIKLPNGDTDIKYVPKANPETGDVYMYQWPKSGVCPYCLPFGTIDRKRIAGENRKENRRRSKYERKRNEGYFKDPD